MAKLLIVEKINSTVTNNICS